MKTRFVFNYEFLLNNLEKQIINNKNITYKNENHDNEKYSLFNILISSFNFLITPSKRWFSSNNSNRKESFSFTISVLYRGYGKIAIVSFFHVIYLSLVIFLFMSIISSVMVINTLYSILKSIIEIIFSPIVFILGIPIVITSCIKKILGKERKDGKTIIKFVIWNKEFELMNEGLKSC